MTGPAIDLELVREAVEVAIAHAGPNDASLEGWECLLALIDGQSVSEMPQKGRCPNNAAPGGCQLPNRFCTFPSCDKVDELQPTKGEGE